MNLSADYLEKLEKANISTVQDVAKLKDALNTKIASVGIENANPDYVELARFLNEAEGSALDFAMQGASFGFSDEIMGSLSSLPSNFATSVERYGMETYRNKSPIKATVSEVGGALLPSLVKIKPTSGGRTLSPQSADMLSKVVAKTKDFFNPTLTSSIRSGAYGTVYGLGKEEGTAKERFGKYQPYINGLASAALSYPIRILSRGTGAIIDAFTDMPSASKGRELAVQEVREALMQDHGSVEEALVSAYNSMGTDRQLTLADLGTNSRGVLEMVNLIPGIGRKNAVDFLQSRAEGRYGRIVSDLQEAFGNEADYYVSYKAIEDAKKSVARGMYDDAFTVTYDDGTKAPRLIDMESEFGIERVDAGGNSEQDFYTLNELMARPSLQKALGRAMEIGAEDGIDLPLVEVSDTGLVVAEGDDKGKPVDAITYQFAHYLKLGLDDLISVSNSPIRQETSMGPTAVAKMMDTKNKFITALDSNENYKQARDTFAGFSAVQDAMDMGKDIFSKKSLNPEDAMALMGDGEKEAYRLGVFQAIFDKVEAGSTSRDLGKLIFQSERNKRLIRSTFPEGERGDQMFNTFFNNIGEEMDTRATEIKIQGGSDTAQRTERLKRFRDKALRQITNEELSPRNILNQAIGIDFELLNNEQMMGASEKIADILTETEYDEVVKKLQGGRTFGESVSSVNPFKMHRILKAIVGTPNSPYVIADVVSQISDEIDEQIDIEGLAPEIIDEAKRLLFEEEARPNLQGRVDNFDRSTPTSVSEKVMPQERESIATQLDSMLANVKNQSDIPLVPPVTSVTPEAMLSETILPNPDDREIAQRMMGARGIGSLMS